MITQVDDPLMQIAGQVADCFSKSGYAFVEGDKVETLAAVLGALLAVTGIPVDVVADGPICNGTQQAKRIDDRLVERAVTAIEVDHWSGELDRLHARFADRFTRSEPRRRARQYLFGLVAGLDRGNSWTLAEQAGDLSPDGMQRLLRWADWDIDAVSDYVIVKATEMTPRLVPTVTNRWVDPSLAPVTAPRA